MANTFLTDIDWQPVIFFYKNFKLFASMSGSEVEFEITDGLPDIILEKAKIAREKLSLPVPPSSKIIINEFD